ncbi:AIPR family protein [Stenotrophomonas lactitubi]|uniref:AIPR family protein n=1 Tax=Stenotrophomonas lactitubi TaxID=2045214 RepID=UPI003209E877
MATNDALLIDGLIDDLLLNEGNEDRGRVFEAFALQQILRDWDLSADEISVGWVDGRQDGGVDGFYVLVNGVCITEVSDFSWPKTSADIVVLIITCKHAGAFVQAPIDALIASLTEILDLSIDDTDLKGAYSHALLKCRAKLLYAYRKLAPKLSSFKINVTYASRGDKSAGLGFEVVSRANQVVDLIKNRFNGAIAEFEFVGSGDLIELHRRRPNFSLDLPFVSFLNNGGGNYVLLVQLRDYFQFCMDEGGKLRRYLFDANVRDFMGVNRVNFDISRTLADPGSPDFWWLNNGVTILATSAWSTGSVLHMNNVQIVNGLQTTESIFRHFSESCEALNASDVGLRENDSRSVMVKVISSVDEGARDKIIRATNNQTSVEQISLHATDKIQKDIEDALLREGFYYERRRNYYVNRGVAVGSIVSPMYLAASLIALGSRREPWSAAALKQRHLRDDGLYRDVFSISTSFEVCASVVRVMKTVDGVLDAARSRGASEGFLKKNRYILSLLALARKFGTFNYSDRELVGVSCDRSFIELIGSTLESIPEAWKGLGRNKSGAVELCELFADNFGIQGVERIRAAARTLKRFEAADHKRRQLAIELPRNFVECVLDELPPQPWKPGVHLHVIGKLRCRSVDYYSAVESLIEEGRLFRQQDGVLYNRDGAIAGFDSERVVLDEQGVPRLIGEQ